MPCRRPHSSQTFPLQESSPHASFCTSFWCHSSPQSHDRKSTPLAPSLTRTQTQSFKWILLLVPPSYFSLLSASQLWLQHPACMPGSPPAARMARKVTISPEKGARRENQSLCREATNSISHSSLKTSHSPPKPSALLTCFPIWGGFSYNQNTTTLPTNVQRTNTTWALRMPLVSSS